MLWCTEIYWQHANFSLCRSTRISFWNCSVYFKLTCVYVLTVPGSWFWEEIRCSHNTHCNPSWFSECKFSQIVAACIIKFSSAVYIAYIHNCYWNAWHWLYMPLIITCSLICSMCVNILPRPAFDLSRYIVIVYKSLMYTVVNFCLFLWHIACTWQYAVTTLLL